MHSFDVVAIDIGTSHVGLCRWDGRALVARKLPAAPPEQAWAAWIDALHPAGPYSVLFRWPAAELAEEQGATGCLSLTSPMSRMPSPENARAGKPPVVPDRRASDALGSPSQPLPLDTIKALARSHGAIDFRALTAETCAYPALAAARYAADLEHLGRILVVEAGASGTSLGIVEPDGRASAQRFLPTALPADGVHSIEPLIRRFLESDAGPPDAERSGLPLVCGGGAGPPVAAALAEACGLRRVLIPPHAGVMATIGMLLADIVIRLEERMPHPTGTAVLHPTEAVRLHPTGAAMLHPPPKAESVGRPVDIAALRQAFGRLMDRASDEITREGYDLDDAVCQRSALVGPAGGDLVAEVTCDDLADSSRVFARFHSAYSAQRMIHKGASGCLQPVPHSGQARAGEPLVARDPERMQTFEKPSTPQATDAPLEVRAVRLKATIHTHKPEFPIAPAPTHALDAAILHHPPADAIVPPGAIAYSRDALPVDVDLAGPAAICEPFTTTVVPRGWTARRTTAGGLMLVHL